MKRNATLSIVATIAGLAFAAQSFAFGGGEGRMGGSRVAGPMISSTMPHGPMNGAGPQNMHGLGSANGNGMQQGPQKGTGTKHGALNGAGPQSTRHGRAGNTHGFQHTQKQGAGSLAGTPAQGAAASTGAK